MTGPLANPAFQPNRFFALGKEEQKVPKPSKSQDPVASAVIPTLDPPSSTLRQLDLHFFCFNPPTTTKPPSAHPARPFNSSILAAIRQIRISIALCRFPPRCAQSFHRSSTLVASSPTKTKQTRPSSPQVYKIVPSIVEFFSDTWPWLPWV